MNLSSTFCSTDLITADMEKPMHFQNYTKFKKSSSKSSLKLGAAPSLGPRIKGGKEDIPKNLFC